MTGGNVNLIVIVKNSINVSKNIKYRHPMMQQNTTSYVFKGNEISILNIRSYSQVYCVLFKIVKKFETTYVSNILVDKENKTPIQNRIVLNHNEEWNNLICDNMGRTGDNYGNWIKSDTDKYYVISLIWQM